MKKLWCYFLFLMLSGWCYAEETSYLFYQSSSQAEIVKQSENQYTLTLRGDTDYVTYFTDRPARQTGVLKLDDFLKLWKDSSIKNNFEVDPPNAAIVMVAENGDTQSAVAVITNPTRHLGQVTYQLRPLGDQPLSPEKLKHITLIFDDIHWNPGGF